MREIHIDRPYLGPSKITRLMSHLRIDPEYCGDCHHEMERGYLMKGGGTVKRRAYGWWFCEGCQRWAFVKDTRRKYERKYERSRIQ